MRSTLIAMQKSYPICFLLFVCVVCQLCLSCRDSPTPDKARNTQHKDASYLQQLDSNIQLQAGEFRLIDFVASVFQKNKIGVSISTQAAEVKANESFDLSELGSSEPEDNASTSSNPSILNLESEMSVKAFLRLLEERYSAQFGFDDSLWITLPANSASSAVVVTVSDETAAN